MAHTYNVIACDVGSGIDLPAYNAELTGQLKKFKWIEPLVRELGKGGYEFAYNFGAIVFVNVEGPKVKALLSDARKFVKNISKKPNMEECLLEVRSSLRKEEVSFDKVSIPKMSLDMLKILTFALAQSVTLASSEHMADSALDEIEDILDEFKKTGKVRKEKQLIQSVASAAKMRYSIISDLSLLDKPSVTWESKRLNRFYESLEEMFELRSRLSIVEHKLNTVLDNCGLILNITGTKKSLFVEWTIVVLFVIDVILILVDILK